LKTHEDEISESTEQTSSPNLNKNETPHILATKLGLVSWPFLPGVVKKLIA